MPFYPILFLLFFSSPLFAQEESPQFFTSFDARQIAYYDEGEGTPVFLLHGFLNTSKNWREAELHQRLIDAGFRVIVPDLRGNGASVKQANEEIYRNNGEVRDLEGLADHLKLKQFHAIGYSRGSIVLGEWILRDRRVKKAVFGGMGLDFTDPEWPRRKAFAAAFLGTEPLDETTRGAVEYAKSISLNLQVMGWLQQYQPSPSKDQLKKYKSPVLVIAGDQDLDNGSPAGLAEVFKKGSLSIIPGDHNNSYKGAEFADTVLDFLQ